MTFEIFSAFGLGSLFGLFIAYIIEVYSCKHEWEYKGESKYYVNCPHCYNKVKVEDKNEMYKM